jgi:hypothetical protein
MPQQQQRPQHATLGADTFRGAGSFGSRPLFFGKTLGQLELERSGLLKVASPISGATLTVPDGSGPNHHASIRDPLTGTVLSLWHQAQIVTPVLEQPQVRLALLGALPWQVLLYSNIAGEVDCRFSSRSSLLL